MLSMSIDVLYFFKIKPLNYYDSVAFYYYGTERSEQKFEKEICFT